MAAASPTAPADRVHSIFTRNPPTARAPKNDYWRVAVTSTSAVGPRMAGFFCTGPGPGDLRHPQTSGSCRSQVRVSHSHSYRHRSVTGPDGFHQTDGG